MAFVASDGSDGGSSESPSISAWPVRRQRRQHASRQMDAMRQQLNDLATRLVAVEAFIDKNLCSDMRAMIKHEVGVQLKHAQVSIRLSCNEGAGDQNDADPILTEVVDPVAAKQPEPEASPLAGPPPGLACDDACGEDLPSVPQFPGFEPEIAQDDMPTFAQSGSSKVHGRSPRRTSTQEFDSAIGDVDEEHAQGYSALCDGSIEPSCRYEAPCQTHVGKVAVASTPRMALSTSADVQNLPASTRATNEVAAVRSESETEEVADLPAELKQLDPLFRAQVGKMYGNTLFRGYIEDIEVGKMSGERLYLVHYADDDIEHLSATEARQLLLESPGL